MKARRYGGSQDVGLPSRRPAVAEESELLASDLGPHRRPIIVIFSRTADELRMVTVCRCGRSGVLAARLRSVSRPIRHVTHATFFYIYGDGIWIFLLLFWARAVVFPLYAIDSSTPMDYRVGVCVQGSIGSSTVLTPSASRRYQVGNSCHALCLSGFVGCS